MDELMKLYEENEGFREYVDRYCWNRNLTLDVALTHAIVVNAASYYSGKQNL